MFTDDPVRDAERHAAGQDEELAHCPKCARCGYEIQDEKLFDIDGDLYHISCAEEEFEKYTEEYM